MSISISRALRNRTTLRAKITTLANRIYMFAVVDKGSTPDFNSAELMSDYNNELSSLRNLKMSCIKASLSTMVKIPDSAPVPEAGQILPVYHAVLVRDDLKNMKAMRERLINTPTASPRVVSRYVLPEASQPEAVERERTFDFAKLLEEVEVLQDAIDEIDGLVQATDATSMIEV